VHQTVLKHLHPEHVEVEIGRADELEVRRGLSSELDEMWELRAQQSQSELVMARHWCAVKAAWRNVARPWGIQVPLEPLGLSLMGHLMR
jgi:hypothetical protein